VRVRRVAACAAVALALAGLSACQTKAGAAAFVGDDRISQSEVNKYVQAGFTVPSAAPGQQQNEPPRVLALDTMIESRLLAAVLGRSGGVPSDDVLNGLHDKAFSFQLQAQVQGDEADRQLGSLLVKSGMKDRFLPVFLRNLELKQAVIDKINAQAQTQVAAEINKLGIKVKVNERYGAWSTQTASLTSYTPGYLNLDTGAATTPPPAGG
jgi:hypothetical protein